MTRTVKIIIGVVVVILVVLGLTSINKKAPVSTNETIKIGVIEPLTGDLAFWGQSSKLGIELAQKELQAEGVNVQFIVEDGNFDPKTALNAAQKLVTVDKVDAIYDEFNPITIPVASYLKDKNIFNLYYAANTSPLADNPNTIKSYLDFEESCKEVAQFLQQRGVKWIAMLKANLEYSDLCWNGVKSVYGESVPLQTYNIGDRDLRTQLTKLDASHPEFIFNVTFQPEALVTVQNMRDLGIKAKFVGSSELESGTLAKNPGLFEGAILFGMPLVSEEFVNKLKTAFPDQSNVNAQAASAPYVHAKQLAYALRDCNKELECVKAKIENAKPDPIIGFQGFKNRVAFFNTYIEEVINNQFVPVKQ